MHVGAGWIAVIALLGAAVLLMTLPAAGEKKAPIPEPDHEAARNSEAGTTQALESVLGSER